jgi:hypothetical protein
MLLPLSFYYRPLQKGRVKGRTEAVTLVEVFNAETDAEYVQKLRIKDDYETAMRYYQQGKLTEALKIFSAINELLPGDKATTNYIRLCNKYLAKGIHENWNGVESFYEVVGAAQN